MHRLSLPIVLAACAACARPKPVPAPRADPCRGTALDLYAAATACRVGTGRPPPPSSALALELVPAQVDVAPGGTAALQLRMVNTTSAPLQVPFDLACADLTPTAALLDGGSVDVGDDDCGFGGLCGGAEPAQVTLEPGGALVVPLRYTAVRGRAVARGDSCETVDAGPLRAGDYTLEVRSPFRDPVPGSLNEVTTRRLRAPLHVRR